MLHYPNSDQWQDDLAEHAVQSPVWNELQASLELDDLLDDWEFYHDDFFDEYTPKKRTHMQDHDGTHAKRRKRQKVAAAR